MRPTAQADGLLHPADGLPSDHHNAPYSVAIENTSQSLPPGTTYNLDIALGSSAYQYARVQLLGARIMTPSISGWRECAEILVTRDATEAIGHSQMDTALTRVYSATYSKLSGDSYLTGKIFDSNTGLANQYIALQDAVLTGSVLRLTFRNFFGGSATLWVKGKALLW